MIRILKKAVLFTVIAVLLVVCMLPSYAAQSEFKTICDEATEPIKNAIVYDMTNNMILYTKNADEKISIASITKVLNACTAAQYIKADEVLTIGKEIYLISSNASVAPVDYGESYTFEQLMHALLLPSGCDVAFTFATVAGRRAAGDESLSEQEAIDVFIGEMNRYMDKLGCRNSHFSTADGQDTEGQYSTCRDYIRVLHSAMENELIRSVVCNAYYSCNDQSGNYHEWYTTNGMLQQNSTYYYPGVIGIKTGSTTDAGYCLAVAAERDGRTLITLVMGADPLWVRYEVTEALLDAAFALQLMGDVDGDGQFTSADARLTQRGAMELEPITAYDFKNGDMDGDGYLSPEDAQMVLRVAVGREYLD